MCLYLFKTSELVRYDQHDFEFELIFRCETCYCIFANKAAESYEFFADQTSPTSSAELMEPSKNLELRNVGETCSDISDISELFNRPSTSWLFLSFQTLAMICFLLLPMILRGNLVNLFSDAKAVTEN